MAERSPLEVLIGEWRMDPRFDGIPAAEEDARRL